MKTSFILLLLEVSAGLRIRKSASRRAGGGRERDLLITSAQSVLPAPASPPGLLERILDFEEMAAPFDQEPPEEAR